MDTRVRRAQRIGGREDLVVAEAGTPPLGQSSYVVGVLGGPSLDLQRNLDSEGVRFVIAGSDGSTSTAADVLLVDLTETHRADIDRSTQHLPEGGAPVMAAIGWDLLRTPDVRIAADDVIVVPWRLGELSMRISRLLDRKVPPAEAKLISAGDLVIDPERYDVYVANKPVLLTFKEYELLKLLASNPGRVYSREALLEQVWGYQYFGGTRTVDVHVRRLRSKIEDATHTFIDTVWNVGYRFHG
jgi:two-component system, OmpR family, alkaline phosphatase synthesis response regulator PhoP